MKNNFLQKSFTILLKRQTNILSAALALMLTVILSQVLGVVRLRLLASIFGASNTLGVYFASSKLPDFLFQVLIAGALSSAFIPVFTDFIRKKREDDANGMASGLLSMGIVAFGVLSLILFIFAPFFLTLLNLGAGFSPKEMDLMVNLMRIILLGQMIFLIATFFSALLQSFNHFFIPGIAAAFYNLGIILGIYFLSKNFGIYSAAYGVVLGSLVYALIQIPIIRKVGFKFKPSFSINTPGIKEVSTLMWPRTLSIFVFQIGTVITVSLVSFLPSAGRNYVIFDFAQTLFFAPIALFGQTMAQAAFPVLAREKDNMEEFAATFRTSYSQILFLVMPIMALFLVLRIPMVRLIFGASKLDWQATVLTGRTLAFFSLSIFAQALVYLVSRAFYALHDTKTPLAIGAFSTILTIVLSGLFIFFLNPQISSFELTHVNSFRIIPSGVEGIAFAYTLAGIINLILLLIFLNKKVRGLFDRHFIVPQIKIFIATFFMGIALYIPIKLLDQLVFDTTKTINLFLLTGISALAGFGLYFFLTWLFNVKEASTFLLLFKKLGNWKEILGKSESVIDTRLN